MTLVKDTKRRFPSLPFKEVLKKAASEYKGKK
jgi:hypothetical protein